MIYYGDPCASPGQHTCSDCLDLEFAKVRGIGLMEFDFSLEDWTSTEEWQQAIADGDIDIVPNLRGSYTANPVEGAGYGNLISTLLFDEHQLNVFDPEFVGNVAFWNAYKKLRTKKVVWITENYVFVPQNNKKVSITTPTNISDNDGEVIEQAVVFKWRDRDAALPYAIPSDIFECFIEG